MLQIYTTQPNLTVINGEIKTTSLVVSEHFEKQHKDVLKAISNMECSEEFTRRNFAPSFYLAGNGKQEPCFEITYKGFLFLALGFTGKKAAEIREWYIEEFDRMEKELKLLTIAPLSKLIEVINQDDIKKIEIILKGHINNGLLEESFFQRARWNEVSKKNAKKILNNFVCSGVVKVIVYEQSIGYIRTEYFWIENT